MIEAWRTKLNCGNKIGALIMDLSKSFDTINHDYFLSLLIKVYGFNENSVSFVRSYLTNRYQRRKIGNTFSDWNKIITGAPQCLILGPLIFNILLIICCICRYNTLYSANKNISQIISDLSNDFEILNETFPLNGSMIAIWY